MDAFKLYVVKPNFVNKLHLSGLVTISSLLTEKNKMLNPKHCDQTGLLFNPTSGHTKWYNVMTI